MYKQDEAVQRLEALKKKKKRNALFSFLVPAAKVVLNGIT